MRVISLSVIFIAVVTVFAFVNAFPTDNNDVGQNTGLSDVYEIIPDETPDSVLSDDTTTTRRVKRSDIIGFIRQICPPLANFINNVYQQARKIVFKLIGRLLLGGNKKRPTGGEEKPAVVVNLPEYPAEDTTTSEPVTDTDSSFSSDSTPSTESTSSSDSSSTETSPSSESASSKSSSPPSENSLADTTSSTSKTTSTTESHSIGQTNSISTK